MLSLIVAIADRYAIGKNNQLLCHLPADLRRFKDLTTGHTVIMGRRTFESLPNGALPKRRNIVISRTWAEKEEGNLIICSSLEKVLERCGEEDEVFIIGGAEIYNKTIQYADILYITEIKHTFEDADTFFPLIEPTQWEKIAQEDYRADEKNPYDYSFIKYKRR